MAENTSAQRLPSVVKRGTLFPVGNLELSKLQGDNFDAQQYISNILTPLTEEQVRAFRESLAITKQEASTNLKKNVYTNYRKFQYLRDRKVCSSLSRDQDARTIRIGIAYSVTRAKSA